MHLLFAFSYLDSQGDQLLLMRLCRLNHVDYTEKKYISEICQAICQVICQSNLKNKKVVGWAGY